MGEATSPADESLKAEDKGASREVLCHLEVDGLGGQADKQCHVRLFKRRLAGVASLSGEGTGKVHSYALKRSKRLSHDCPISWCLVRARAFLQTMHSLQTLLKSCLASIE